MGNQMKHQQKIEYVANRIAPILKDGLNAMFYAECIVNELDDDDDDNGYRAHIEVRALHTRNNKPFTFWL